ncbi:MAG: long-chain fatty acid--CoA ligase [Desulfatiglandaceae bacterium]
MGTPVEKSIPAVFQNQADRYSDTPCIFCKNDGVYRPLSWTCMQTMVRNLAGFLISQDIRKGDRIAIFSPNRFEWWIADLAALSIGAVDVPIYSTNSAEEARYILEHSGSRLCFTGEEEHLQKTLELRTQLPELQAIVTFNNSHVADNKVIPFERALSEGRSAQTDDLFDARLEAVGPEDKATIIYTSGTTGPPKGVMLSHGNFLSNVNQIMTDFSGLLEPDDIFLSFLPLSHALERTAGFYLPIKMGATVAFAESFLTIQQNLQEIKPTIIVSVPRLYEKIHTGVLAKVKNASAVKKALFMTAMKCAARNVEYVCNAKERKGMFELRYSLADRLIFSKLKSAIGMERLKFAVSGGGALSVKDAEFFLGIGILVLEGFGLTETSPVTHVNRPSAIQPGSVGTPLSGTRVKIDSSGEILIKGPQVMIGYYRDEAATKAVFTEDGFFRTGDVGVIDEKGRLTITGRIKEVIITSGGKSISPQNIENTLKASKYIEQAAVIGEKRKYLSALIVPALDELMRWASSRGIRTNSIESLLNEEHVKNLYEQELAECNAGYARAEQIRKFTLLPDEWTQETGELTPTLKLKRHVVERKYADLIENMYPPEI